MAGLYVSAIGFTAGLLFTGYAGIIYRIMLITATNAGALADALSPVDLSPESRWSARENENEAFLIATCRDELRLPVKPFDSTLAATTEWSFLDSNVKDHFLTITAELTYQDLISLHYYIISTSVTLNMYINQPPATPSTPSGPTSGYTSTTYTYSTSTTDPEGDSIQYQFDWGDDTNTTTGWYAPSATASASHSWSSPGTYHVSARAKDAYGAWSGWSPSLQVSISYALTVRTYRIQGPEITGVEVWIDNDPERYSPVTVPVTPETHTIQVDSRFWRLWNEYTFHHWQDGSKDNPRSIYIDGSTTLTAYYNRTYHGTCPTLFLWNGTDYVYETLLDIHGDSDVTLQHQIEQPLVKDGHFYKLSLRELDNFTSHIDQVKLYGVDSSGRALPSLLAEAVHSELGNVRMLLRHDDDRRVDLYPTQTIDLRFYLHNANDITHFIFEINGHNKKEF